MMPLFVALGCFLLARVFIPRKPGFVRVDLSFRSPFRSHAASKIGLLPFQVATVFGLMLLKTRRYPIVLEP